MENKKVSSYAITKDVCMCASVFSSQVCKLFDLYPLCLYTQQVTWRCMQQADYCCHNHGFTTSVFTESFTLPLTHSYGICACIHMTKHTCTHTDHQIFPQLKPKHLAKHVAWPLISMLWMEMCFRMGVHGEARAAFGAWLYHYMSCLSVSVWARNRAEFTFNFWG